jgi:hypothetical protein
VLTVEDITQEQDQWCWSACSRCMLLFYGIDEKQCEIAEYTRTSSTTADVNLGTTNCCTSATLGCNTWNYDWGTGGSIEDIMDHFVGATAVTYDTVLPMNQLVATIDAQQLFLIRWQWTDGSGHFLVGHGYDNTTVYYMNPWPGEGLEFRRLAHLGQRHDLLRRRDQRLQRQGRRRHVRRRRRLHARRRLQRRRLRQRHRHQLPRHRLPRAGCLRSRYGPVHPGRRPQRRRLLQRRQPLHRVRPLQGRPVRRHREDLPGPRCLPRRQLRHDQRQLRDHRGRRRHRLPAGGLHVGNLRRRAPHQAAHQHRVHCGRSGRSGVARPRWPVGTRDPQALKGRTFFARTAGGE